MLLNYDEHGTLLNESRTLGPAIAGFLQPQLAVGADGRRLVATDDGLGTGTIAASNVQGERLFSQDFEFLGFSGVTALEVADDLSAFMATVQLVDGVSGYVVRKFAATGEELWAFGATSDTGLVLSDAFLVPQVDGGVILAGSPETSCLAAVTRVWRLDANGEAVWVRDLPGGCEFSLVVGMAGGPDGEVYIADSAIVSRVYRLEPDGTVAWATPVESLPGFTTRFIGMDFADGRLLVGGTDADSGFTMINSRVSCYDTKGLLQWSQVFEDQEIGDTFFADVAAGAGSGALVATRRADNLNFQNTLVVGFDFECPGDITGNGAVDVLDLVEMLAAWGTNPGNPADLDGDGTVGTLDLLGLLAAWGPCA